MTYGVPYAFVPGTKAKADEVNANFNDIISKIQDTNDLVAGNYNTLDSRCDTLSNTCTTLTNGLASANSAIATKANASDIDGTWTARYLNLANALTWNVGTNTKSYSLSSYLPNDNNIYEVLLSGDGNTGTSSGSGITCTIISTYAPNYCVLYKSSTRAAASVMTGGCTILPVGRDRTISQKMAVTVSKTGNTYLNAVAYRKVR